MLRLPRRPPLAAITSLTVLLIVALALATGPRPRAAAQQPPRGPTRLAAAAEDLAAGHATEARATYLAVLLSTAAASPVTPDSPIML